MTMGFARRLIRRVARQRGYDIVRILDAPFGYDAMIDIQRLCNSPRRPVDVVFDVGANVGQTVRRITEAFPTARVFAFEPTPETFDALKANVAHLPNVEIFDIALGRESRKAEFFTYDSPFLNSLVENAPYSLRFGPAAKKTEVQMTALDEFCATRGVDHISVLKVDTEGFDLPILQGAANLFANGKIDFVFIEFNDVVLKKGASGGALAPLCEYLYPYNFHFVASYNENVVREGELFVVSNALLVRT